MSTGERLVFAGGVIRTMDPAAPRAEAVAVEGSRIAAVGTLDEVRSRVGRAERIDLQGRLLLPGFIDAHNHYLATGKSMASVDVRFPAVGSTGELVRAIAAAAQKIPPGQWIRAWGFDHAKYGDRRPPNRWDLDGATTRHPVAVSHISGHCVLVNSMALSLRGIDEFAPDPAGGVFAREPDGRLSGLCEDSAMGLVLPVAVGHRLARSQLPHPGPSRGARLRGRARRAGLRRGRPDHRVRPAGHLARAGGLPGGQAPGPPSRPDGMHAAFPPAGFLSGHRAGRPARR